MRICIYLTVTIMWIFKKDLSYDIIYKERRNSIVTKSENGKLYCQSGCYCIYMNRYVVCVNFRIATRRFFDICCFIISENLNLLHDLNILT